MDTATLVGTRAAELLVSSNARTKPASSARFFAGSMLTVSVCARSHADYILWVCHQNRETSLGPHNSMWNAAQSGLSWDGHVRPYSSGAVEAPTTSDRPTSTVAETGLWLAELHATRRMDRDPGSRADR